MAKGAGQEPPAFNPAVTDLHREVGWELSQRLSDAAIANANHAFNMLLLLNGGAAVAVLALVGSIATASAAQLGSAIAVEDFGAALLWFAAGAGAAVLGMMISYFSNSSFAQAAAERGKDAKRSLEKRANRFLIAAVISASISFSCFAYAIFKMHQALSSVAA